MAEARDTSGSQPPLADADKPYCRLRQVCLATENLAAAAEAMQALFSAAPCFHDDGVAQFGLRNLLFALDGTYLEFVAPVSAAAPVNRFLARGDDRGAYLVAFDGPDRDVARRRVGSLGARIVFETTRPDGGGFQVHPADAGDVIFEIDSHRGGRDLDGPYAWAEDYAQFPQRKHLGVKIVGLEHASSDEAAAARRWAELLGRTPAAGADSRRRLHLDNGFVDFRRAGPTSSAGVRRLNLTAERASQINEAARRLGLRETGGGFAFFGVALTVSPAVAHDLNARFDSPGHRSQ